MEQLTAERDDLAALEAEMRASLEATVLQHQVPLLCPCHSRSGVTPIIFAITWFRRHWSLLALQSAERPVSGNSRPLLSAM